MKILCKFFPHKYSGEFINRRHPKFVVRQCKRCKKIQVKNVGNAAPNGFRKGLKHWVDLE